MFEHGIGKTYLITTDSWFFAPNGEQHKAVFGEVHAILKDEETLGIKTNRGSANWYVSIGGMIIAGCQIHYAIQTDTIDTKPPVREIEHEGQLNIHASPFSRIYCA